MLSFRKPFGQGHSGYRDNFVARENAGPEGPLTEILMNEMRMKPSFGISSGSRGSDVYTFKFGYGTSQKVIRLYIDGPTGYCDLLKDLFAATNCRFTKETVLASRQQIAELFTQFLTDKQLSKEMPKETSTDIQIDDILKYRNEIIRKYLAGSVEKNSISKKEDFSFIPGAKPSWILSLRVNRNIWKFSVDASGKIAKKEFEKYKGNYWENLFGKNITDLSELDIRNLLLSLRD